MNSEKLLLRIVESGLQDSRRFVVGDDAPGENEFGDDLVFCRLACSNVRRCLEEIPGEVAAPRQTRRHTKKDKKRERKKAASLSLPVGHVQATKGDKIQKRT